MKVWEFVKQLQKCNQEAEIYLVGPYEPISETEEEWYDPQLREQGVKIPTVLIFKPKS